MDTVVYQTLALLRTHTSTRIQIHTHRQCVIMLTQRRMKKHKTVHSSSLETEVMTVWGPAVWMWISPVQNVTSVKKHSAGLCQAIATGSALYSYDYPFLCSPRPHNNHQLPAQLLLWLGHREEELPRLHRSDEGRHAGEAWVCALAHDGR